MKISVNLTPPQRDMWVKWATALESGRFEQCTGVLYDEDDNKYCSLGVFDRLFDVGGYPDDDSRYGFVSNSSDYGYSDLALKFIKMNDRCKLSFVQIAANIRAMLDDKDLPFPFGEPSECVA